MDTSESKEQQWRLYEAVARPRAAADGIGCGHRLGASMSEGSLGPSYTEEDWYRGRPAGWEGHAHLTRRIMCLGVGTGGSVLRNMGEYYGNRDKSKPQDFSPERKTNGHSQ